MILYTCPPRKNCKICESRLNQVFGSADKSKKYLHMANERGQKAVNLLLSGSLEKAIAEFVTAGSFANLALGN